MIKFQHLKCMETMIVVNSHVSYTAKLELINYSLWLYELLSHFFILKIKEINFDKKVKTQNDYKLQQWAILIVHFQFHSCTNFKNFKGL